MSDDVFRERFRVELARRGIDERAWAAEVLGITPGRFWMLSDAPLRVDSSPCLVFFNAAFEPAESDRFERSYTWRTAIESLDEFVDMVPGRPRRMFDEKKKSLVPRGREGDVTIVEGWHGRQLANECHCEACRARNGAFMLEGWTSEVRGYSMPTSANEGRGQVYPIVRTDDAGTVTVNIGPGEVEIRCPQCRVSSSTAWAGFYMQVDGSVRCGSCNGVVPMADSEDRPAVDRMDDAIRRAVIGRPGDGADRVRISGTPAPTSQTTSQRTYIVNPDGSRSLVDERHFLPRVTGGPVTPPT